MGGLEMTNVVIIILVLICVFALLSACCRGLRHAYEDHATSEELARRRALFMSRTTAQVPTTRDGRPSQNMRAVRVTTISQEGDSIAMGVYEIQVPRRPQHQRQAGQLPANLFGTGGVSSSVPRLATAAPRSHWKDPPPPPFSTAYQVSTPVTTTNTTTVIDMDAPPPTYDEYLQIHELGNADTKKDSDGPARY